MKNTRMLKLLGAMITGIILVPAVVFAQAPVIKLFGVQELSSSKAVARVSVVLDKNLEKRASVYVEYTDIETDDSSVTESASYLTSGEQITNFWMNGLVKGRAYEYRAIMEFEGETYTTPKKKFIMGSPNAVAEPAPSTTSTTNTSNTQSSSNQTTNTSTTVSLGSALGAPTAKFTTDLQKKVMTGGVTSKNGVALAITNEQARVDQDDTFTYTVRYQNGRTTSLQNSSIVITLPDAYEFISSTTDLEYNTKTNSVSYAIGRISPNTTKSFTFKARALGESSGELKTTATLYYEGGSLSIADRDSYHSGVTSVLGASVFGAGFFPQTLIGWLLIIGLITIVVIISRRYTQAPVPPQKTA